MDNFKDFLSTFIEIEENIVIDPRAFALAKDLCEWLDNYDKKIINEDIDDDIDDDVSKETKQSKSKIKKDRKEEEDKSKPSAFNVDDPLEDRANADDEEPRTDEEDLDLDDDGKTPEIEDNDEKMAKEWAENVFESKNPDPKVTNYRKTNSVGLGYMYAFTYDPKHKSRLPLYDKKPLVITFEFKPGADGGEGFLGINLHYVPRAERKATVEYFMSKNPESVMKGDGVDIEYERDLKFNNRLAFLYYCIRHYLMSHVIGSFKLIPQNEYPNAYKLHSAEFFPTQRSELQIYQDLRRKSVARTMSQIMKKTQTKKERANQKRREQLRAQREANKKAKEEGQITPITGEQIGSPGLKKEKEIKMVNNPLKEKEKKITGNIGGGK